MRRFFHKLTVVTIKGPTSIVLRGFYRPPPTPHPRVVGDDGRFGINPTLKDYRRRVSSQVKESLLVRWNLGPSLRSFTSGPRHSSTSTTSLVAVQTHPAVRDGTQDTTPKKQRTFFPLVSPDTSL